MKNKLKYSRFFLKRTIYMPGYRESPLAGFTPWIAGILLLILLIAVGLYAFSRGADESDSQQASQVQEQGYSSNAPASTTDDSASEEAPPTTDVEELAYIPEGQIYEVVEVVDGDTIRVNHEGQLERVRLVAVDTPETVNPNQPVECYGPESSAYAKDVLTGQQVELRPDATQSDRDRYGRLLRHVFLPDGTHFNELLVKEGYATYESQYGLEQRYAANFSFAQQEAQSQSRGAWATCW